MLVVRAGGRARTEAQMRLEDSAEWADEELTDSLRVGSEMDW
jgi:hypothetical protein